MNISPLIDLEKLGLKDFGRFTKTRVLKGENILPALLITSIEQLIIKKCFSFSFEVFFGLLFEVGEQFNITAESETKLAISEFTCSIQSLRLKDFRLLQEKEEFFNIINELGKFLDKSNDCETLNCLIEAFAELKVNVMVKSEFYARETRKTESFHSILHVLKHKEEFYLMLEREDYMDDEAIEEEERLKRLEMEEQERIKRRKIERKIKKLEDKRKSEQIMMKDEDVKRIIYLKQERELQENENLYLDKFEYHDRTIVFDEFENNKKASNGLASEEKFFIDFKRKERKKEKVLREMIKNEENNFGRFYSKISKKRGKNLAALERQENLSGRFQGIEKSSCDKSLKALSNEDKILNSLGSVVGNIRVDINRDMGLNEKQSKKFSALEESLREDTLFKLEIEENIFSRFILSQNDLNTYKSSQLLVTELHTREVSKQESIISKLAIKKIEHGDKNISKFIRKQLKVENSIKTFLGIEDHSSQIFSTSSSKLRQTTEAKLDINQNLSINSNENIKLNEGFIKSSMEIEEILNNEVKTLFNQLKLKNQASLEKEDVTKNKIWEIEINQDKYRIEKLEYEEKLMRIFIDKITVSQNSSVSKIGKEEMNIQEVREFEMIQSKNYERAFEMLDRMNVHHYEILKDILKQNLCNFESNDSLSKSCFEIGMKIMSQQVEFMNFEDSLVEKLNKHESCRTKKAIQDLENSEKALENFIQLEENFKFNNFKSINRVNDYLSEFLKKEQAQINFSQIALEYQEKSLNVLNDIIQKNQLKFKDSLKVQSNQNKLFIKSQAFYSIEVSKKMEISEKETRNYKDFESRLEKIAYNSIDLNADLAEKFKALIETLNEHSKSYMINQEKYSKIYTNSLNKAESINQITLASLDMFSRDMEMKIAERNLNISKSLEIEEKYSNKIATYQYETFSKITQILEFSDKSELTYTQKALSTQQIFESNLQIFEQSMINYETDEEKLRSKSSFNLKSEKSAIKKYLKTQSDAEKFLNENLSEELQKSVSFTESEKNLQTFNRIQLEKNENSQKIQIQSQYSKQISTINSVLLDDQAILLFNNMSKNNEKSIQEIFISQEDQAKHIINYESHMNDKYRQNLTKELRILANFKQSELIVSEKEYNLLLAEERLSRRNEYSFKLEQKSQEEKKKAEDKYQEVLRRIELQKIAEKQRQAKEKQVRIEREQKRKAEITNIEIQEDSLNISEISEISFSEECLVHESKLIEAMVLFCGSYFCTQCFRMLKRSSLFLKCGGCCNTEFKSISTLKNEDYPRGKIPTGSLCVGCSNTIIRGEIVRCICCYIRIEFLKDFTPINCNSCMDPEKIDWVDTYIGSKYELVNCGFCERLVNYAYVIEICISCHDQVCLHCLRKNHFLASSVCNECHSRRQVNPYLKIRKNS